MRILGSLLRWLLNINTIWGLMILTAFGLCAAQHYLPTTTVLPADALAGADHTLTVRITGRESRVVERTFRLTPRADGALAIAAEDATARPDVPWLVRCRLHDAPVGRGGGRSPACLLTWDFAGYGNYEVLVGGQTRARGRLVTLQSLTDAAFDYAKTGFDIALGLVASMVLFLGLMRVGQDAGLVQLAARGFHPLIRRLFPDVPKDHPASAALLMNFTTTVLGLGNAATPFGLKAMRELHTLNPHKAIASDAQVMLLGFNTAGFALLPTTLLALRKSAGCSDPFEIIGPCMLAGAAATITALVLARWLARLPLFSVRAALAEAARDGEAAAPATEGAR